MRKFDREKDIPPMADALEVMGRIRTKVLETSDKSSIFGAYNDSRILANKYGTFVLETLDNGNFESARRDLQEVCNLLGGKYFHLLPTLHYSNHRYFLEDPRRYAEAVTGNVQSDFLSTNGDFPKWIYERFMKRYPNLKKEPVNKLSEPSVGVYGFMSLDWLMLFTANICAYKFDGWRMFLEPIAVKPKTEVVVLPTDEQGNIHFMEKELIYLLDENPEPKTDLKSADKVLSAIYGRNRVRSAVGR